MKTVFDNIFTNCLEAYQDYKTQDNLIIDLTINYDQQYIYITIRDYAIGIEKDQCHKIFEPFYTTKLHEKHNVGLGLSVAQQMLYSTEGNIQACTKKQGLEILIKLKNTMAR